MLPGPSGELVGDFGVRQTTPTAFVLTTEPEALAQAFTFWSTLAPRTAFREIFELPPGHTLLADADGLRVQQYWALDFSRSPPGRRR